MKVITRLIYFLALILTACQAESTTVLSPSTLTPISTTPGGSQVTPSLTMPADPDQQALIEKAKEDLARRLGISADSISVASVINQEFSEAAFYCKSPKERIAKEEPSAVSGQSILLVASDRRYEYHANGATVHFCRPLH